MIDTQGLPMPENAPPPGSCVRLERPEPGIAVLVLDPPHRTLAVIDAPLLRDLDLALDEVERDSTVYGIVITGRSPTSFAAGADLDALASVTDPALVGRLVAVGQQVFQRIARLGMRHSGMSVAAVGGAVPGGAYELALACNCIVAARERETKIGLPETQLGILPAWGGTTRLPRRVGVARALETILTGKLYSAREAYAKGLVDRLAHRQDLLAVAIGIAAGRERSPRRGRGWKALLVDRNPPIAGFIASRAREQVYERTMGHYPAPLAALEIAWRAPRRSIEKSLAAEARAVSALAVSPICKNLIAIFRSSEDAKKLGRAPDGKPRRVPEAAGVLGAGVMGRAIASLLAERGVWTRIFDVVPAALDVALAEHRAAAAERLRRRRADRRETAETIDRLDAAHTLAGFAGAGFVIEAVAEKLEVKRQVFGEIARQVRPEAVLATNTSSLSVAAIAEGLPYPERFAGLHFFNPVKKMPLVEVVRGPKTSAETVSACAGLAVHLGKTPVVVADVPGFLVNRVLGPYLDESLRLVAGGVDPARLDRALVEFGMPMGPIALLDEVGFDIATHAAASLHAGYGERMAPCRVLEPMVAAGILGKKTGKGFYDYRAARRGARGRPPLAADLARFVPAGGPALPALTDEELVDRAVLAMLNEAARALEEEVVATPAEVDLASVFGFGFPPFRGGILQFADSLGLHAVLERMRRIAAAPDVAARPGGRQRFEPSDGLEAMARNLRGFHS